jgi:hypothetical protein
MESHCNCKSPCMCYLSNNDAYGNNGVYQQPPFYTNPYGSHNTTCVFPYTPQTLIDTDVSIADRHLAVQRMIDSFHTSHLWSDISEAAMYAAFCKVNLEILNELASSGALMDLNHHLTGCKHQLMRIQLTIPKVPQMRLEPISSLVTAFFNRSFHAGATRGLRATIADQGVLTIYDNLVRVLNFIVVFENLQPLISHLLVHSRLAARLDGTSDFT